MKSNTVLITTIIVILLAVGFLATKGFSGPSDIAS